MNISADHASTQATDRESGSLPEIIQGTDEGQIIEADNVQRFNSRSGRSALAWLGFNLTLFVLYVGFFHLCLVTRFPISLAIGLLIAATMSYLCVRFYRVFINRYEFLFHLALPLDVVLEGLIPYHSGYSFYVCAAAFWSVFIVYRILVVRS